MKKDPHYEEKFRPGSKQKLKDWSPKIGNPNSSKYQMGTQTPKEKTGFTEPFKSVFRRYLISQAKSSEIMAAYQARRAFFAIHLLISTG